MTKVGRLVDNVRLASIANSRVSRSTVRLWRRVESGVITQTAVRVTALVNIGFGVGLRAPEQNDGTLIHHCSARAHANHPRQHHDLCIA